VRTEGSSKAVSVGALSTPLEPGNYTFQAVSGAFGEIVGSSLQITVTPPLEQPDKATFQKYFSDMGLGKLPVGGKLAQDFQQNATIFSSGDLIFLYGTVIQEVQVSAQYYSVATKQSADAPAPPTPMKVGGFASSRTLTLPVGKYDLKVYVGAVLVAVFPFEVLAATSSQPSPTSSEQPDKATFQKYFSDMGLGKLPAGGKLAQDLQQNATIFSSGDSISLYGNVIQEVQISARYYNVATKQSVDAGAPPAPYKVGGFGGAGPLTLPVGKYDLKVYVGAVLVAVFPFEVIATLTTTPSSQPTPQPSPTSSILQPDKTTFSIYFRDMGLGKITTGGKLPQDLQQNVTVFTGGDQLTLYGNIIKECQQPRYEIYYVQANKVVKGGGLSFPTIKPGFDAVGFVSVDTLDVPVGNYEYKVYIGDVFVAVFPFEVR
jgi:hypothetical protein